MKVFFLYSKLSTNLFGIWLPQVISQMMLIYCSTIVWIKMNVMFEWGFPGGSDSKASACSAWDLGAIRGLGRSSGEENGNPLQCSCLENPTDRRAWWTTVHGVARSWTHLSKHTCTVLRALLAWITFTYLLFIFNSFLPTQSSNPGLQPRSPTLQVDSLLAEPEG